MSIFYRHILLIITGYDGVPDLFKVLVNYIVRQLDARDKACVAAHNGITSPPLLDASELIKAESLNCSLRNKVDLENAFNLENSLKHKNSMWLANSLPHIHSYTPSVQDRGTERSLSGASSAGQSPEEIVPPHGGNIKLSIVC